LKLIIATSKTGLLWYGSTSLFISNVKIEIHVVVKREWLTCVLTLPEAIIQSMMCGSRRLLRIHTLLGLVELRYHNTDRGLSRQHLDP